MLVMVCIEAEEGYIIRQENNYSSWFDFLCIEGANKANKQKRLVISRSLLHMLFGSSQSETQEPLNSLPGDLRVSYLCCVGFKFLLKTFSPDWPRLKDLNNY